MKSDLTPRMLRELIADEPDVRAALAEPGKACPPDEALTALAGGWLRAVDVGELAEHLRVCKRCFNLVLLMSDEAPVPQWAIGATREATAQWRQALPDATVHICPFRAVNTRLIGIAAAPPDRGETQIAPSRDYECYAIEVRRGGEAEADVEVVLTPTGGGEARCARTDSSGLARFADLSAGRYTLSIEGCDGPLRLVML